MKCTLLLLDATDGSAVILRATAGRAVPCANVHSRDIIKRVEMLSNRGMQMGTPGQTDGYIVLQGRENICSELSGLCGTVGCCGHLRFWCCCGMRGARVAACPRAHDHAVFAVS